MPAFLSTGGHSDPSPATREEGSGARRPTGAAATDLRSLAGHVGAAPGSDEGEAMELSERIVGDVAIVTINGNVTAHRSETRLTDKVNSLKHQGYTRVVIDLGDVTYMDSSGLGTLIQAYATMRKAGGALKLMHVETRLRDLLTITKLVTVFETFDDEASALASFEAVRASGH
jgi:anti-sigma B factor antagonist